MCLSLYFLRDLAFNNEYTGKQGKKQTEGNILTHIRIYTIFTLLCVPGIINTFYSVNQNFSIYIYS